MVLHLCKFNWSQECCKLSAENFNEDENMNKLDINKPQTLACFPPLVNIGVYYVYLFVCVWVYVGVCVRINVMWDMWLYEIIILYIYCMGCLFCFPRVLASPNLPPSSQKNTHNFLFTIWQFMNLSLFGSPVVWELALVNKYKGLLFIFWLIFESIILFKI